MTASACGESVSSNLTVLYPPPTISQIVAATVAASTTSTPTPSTLGGVFSSTPVAHQFLTGIGTDGNSTHAQPSAADITGLAPVAASGSYNDLSGVPATFTPTSYEATFTSVTSISISASTHNRGTHPVVAVFVNNMQIPVQIGIDGSGNVVMTNLALDNYHIKIF